MTGRDARSWRQIADVDAAIGALTDVLDAVDRLMTTDASGPQSRRDVAALAGRVDALRDALPRARCPWEEVRRGALDDLRKRRGILDQPAIFGVLTGAETGPSLGRPPR